MHFSLQIRYLYKQTKIGRRKKKRDIFKWNLLLSDEDMHLGDGTGREVGVLNCVLKSQINEHDKLLLLALALPQVAKWHCLTLYSESLMGSPDPPLTPTLSLSIDLGQPL